MSSSTVVSSAKSFSSVRDFRSTWKRDRELCIGVHHPLREREENTPAVCRHQQSIKPASVFYSLSTPSSFLCRRRVCHLEESSAKRLQRNAFVYSACVFLFSRHRGRGKERKKISRIQIDRRVVDWLPFVRHGPHLSTTEKTWFPIFIWKCFDFRPFWFWLTVNRPHSLDTSFNGSVYESKEREKKTLLLELECIIYQ